MQVLGNADRVVVRKAVPASMDLTPLDGCRDVTSLMALVPEPTEPGRRAALESVRRSLAEFRANINAGRDSAVRDQADTLVTRARR